MRSSHRIKYLLVTSLAVIILAFAANEGARDVPDNPSRIQKGIPYPYVPLQMDPSIVDPSIGSAEGTAVQSKPAVPARPVVSAEA